MTSNRNLITLIQHYQNDLSELYSLLLTLENKDFLKIYNAQNKDLTELKNHAKYLIFFIASFLDIITSLKVLYESNLEWDRKFHIKNALLSIYETIKTFHKHQKEINQLLNSNYSHLQDEYALINIQLREFKKKYNYDTDITSFRNKAGAHYSDNIIEYIKNLNLVDKPSSIIAIKEFGDILDKILGFWEKLVDEMHSQLK